MFLDKIVEQTRKDLIQRKAELPLEQLQQLALEQPRPRDVLEAFEPRDKIHLIAEVKRASPSKGILAPDLDPVETALLYERNGASVISVLTEPHFFLGSPEYLTAIKNAVSIPVLRKDFIIDEYQVYEARAWGADMILLICAILDDQQLRLLHQRANALRMRVLVEVHSREEAQRAIDAGAMIIGVNSRDLASFEMNPYLLRDIREMLPRNQIIVAESGIHTGADVRRLSRYDVQAMLVGESLVVSNNIPDQIDMLLQGANHSTQVKICGLHDTAGINAAVDAGADLLGLIFYEPSHRYIAPEQVPALLKASQSYSQSASGQVRPDLVGVFVNKDASYINDVVEQVGLHYVQLHGNESPEFCQQIKRPVIKALSLKEQADLSLMAAYQKVAWRLLIDTPTPNWGGTGLTSNWELARQAAQHSKIILAGGLTVENVSAAIQQVQPWGLDVSSGVETNKQKDIHKIAAFVAQVRSSSIVGEQGRR
ncbi:bifunctional indole-3-glycerol phosphate synthase/phosphoribosylanthranilate isomerase [Dictyobacter alpinus]|uniref:Multifunctional fusion protein n=1 Tax=Dictyobacter alpinus TaxID=2014873 RepID=A0A402B0E4_9CHLR|nr:bifunctional indole-3-glycerol-phosphate synthase TrpC/phosphoribosylanthranilate isomerase TrpF [Dictyobacter alpinus]GCE24831.1 bifunctional indole-3-glycerol phosphate synthase/phosphoribosylanthranilate isomerase [Dictyobacter alpinus]